MTTETLLAALSTDDDWYDEGRCVQDGADAFFVRQGDLGRNRREDQAKALCAICPVLAQCREWALTMGELTGVWAGGTSTAERIAAQHEYDIAS